MLTDDEIADMARSADDLLVFARAVEAAVRKTCEVACAQALLHARADERELLSAREKSA